MWNASTQSDRPRERGDLWQHILVSRIRGNRRAWGLLATLLLAPLVGAFPAAAQSVADFYKGKNIALAISFPPGGGYDLYARILGRHMARHIPGNPAIVPQNMPGVGGLRVAQYLYSAAAPRDGSLFGTFTRMAHIAPLYDPAQKYDAAKFTWLGAITDAVSVCITWHTSPVKTWDDFLTKPTTFGGTGPSGEVDIFTNLYRNVFGAKVTLAAGYTGTGPAMLAIERGEIDGLCGIDWTTLKAQRQHWIKNKQINVIVQTAFRKDPDLPQVPLIMDLTNDPEKQQILRLYVSSHEFARPFAAPPGIPPDRAAALIAAFEATMRDPAFLAETAKHQMEVAPITGARLADMLADLYRTPEAVLAKARTAIAR